MSIRTDPFEEIVVDYDNRIAMYDFTGTSLISVDGNFEYRCSQDQSTGLWQVSIAALDSVETMSVPGFATENSALVWAHNHGLAEQFEYFPHLRCDWARYRWQEAQNLSNDDAESQRIMSALAL